MKDGVGERFKEIKNFLKCETWKSLAKKLDTDDYILYSYRIGKADVSKELMFKLKNFGVNGDWLISGEGEMLLVPISSTYASEMETLRKENIELKAQVRILQDTIREMKVQVNSFGKKGADISDSQDIPIPRRIVDVSDVVENKRIGKKNA